MDLLTRFWRLCKATFSSWLDGMEDPARNLDLALHELEDGYRVSREKVVLALANKKRLERAMRAASQLADRKRQEAKLAVQGGNAAAARRALEDCRRLLATADRDGQSLAQVTADVKGLQAALQGMEERIAEAHRRRRDLGGQLHVGEAKVAIGSGVEQLSAMETGRIGNAEALLAEHVEQLNSEGEARMELADGSADLDLLARELSQVDGRLAQLEGGQGGGR